VLSELEMLLFSSNTTDGKGADVLKEELMRKEEQIERQLMIIHTLEAQIGDR